MLYNHVKQLCIRNGITITELERILEFGNGTIHKWERSEPSLGKVLAVAKYFGVSLDVLVSNEEFPSKESINMAIQFDGYDEEQKKLIKCYMSLIEKRKVG